MLYNITSVRFEVLFILLNYPNENIESEQWMTLIVFSWVVWYGQCLNEKIFHNDKGNKKITFICLLIFSFISVPLTMTYWLQQHCFFHPSFSSVFYFITRLARGRSVLFWTPACVQTFCSKSSKCHFSLNIGIVKHTFKHTGTN